MAQQTIGIGTAVDDGTGDPLRTAFDKTNQNFTDLYSSKVSKSGDTMTGVLTLADGTLGAPSLVFANSATSGLYGTSGSIAVAVGGVRVGWFDTAGFQVLNNSGYIGIGAASDVMMYRDAAGTLAQRNGSNAQALRVYKTYTDASNYERMEMGASLTGLGTTTFGVISRSAGTGDSTIPFYFGTMGAAQVGVVTSGTTRWTWASNGHIFAGADNTYDIGAVAATRVRTLYAGTSTVSRYKQFYISGTTLGSYMQSSVDGQVTMLDSAGTSFTRLNFGSATSSFPSLKRVAAGLAVRVADDTADAALSVLTLTASSNVIGVSSVMSSISYATRFNVSTIGGQFDIYGDTILARDAANVLAQRNGTNAQTFRIYNTWTDASNYERLTIEYTGNTAYIRTQNAGTGSNRSIILSASSAFYFGGGATYQWFVSSSGHLLANVDNTNDIGASGATRPRSIYVGTNLVIGYSTTSTALLHVGPGISLQIHNGAGTNIVPQTVNSQTSGTAMSMVGVADGTRYRRAGFFVDDTNALWGLSGNASSGVIDFVIRNNSAEHFRLSIAGVMTVLGGAVIQGLTVGLGANAVGTNTAFGFSALASGSLSGGLNTAVGYNSMISNTSGINNTAFGYRTLFNNTTGAVNIAVGAYTLYSNTTGQNNVAVGNSAFENNSTASNNVGLGYCAGYWNRTGDGNVALGFQALYYSTTSSNSIAIGRSAGYSTTTRVATLGAITAGSGYTNGTYTGVQLTYSSGSTMATYPTADITVAGGVVTVVTLVSGGVAARDTTTVLSVAAASVGGTGSGFSIPVATLTTPPIITAVGYGALQNNTIGQQNTAFGYQTLYNSTTGDYNFAAGYQTLYSNTTGARNTGIGWRAFYSNTTGSFNTAVGMDCLQGNTTGTNNTAVGYGAGYGVTTGSFNVAIGYTALYSAAAGAANIAVGYGALYNTTGANNVAIGLSALGANVGGSQNIAIGREADAARTSGDSNIVIGYDIDADSTTGSNQINIGGRYFHDRIVLANTTVTASTPVLNLAQTWNNAAVTFTAALINVTDTASTTGYLQDWQVGGVSKASIRKDGVTYSVGGFRLSNGEGVYGDNAVLYNAGFMGWSSTTNATNLTDVRLYRDAASVLALRVGTTAQALRIYNTYTDGSNYERGVIDWLGNEFRVGTGAAGTGTTRSTIISGGGNLYFANGYTNRWWISNGHFLTYADNVYDIGQSGTTRPRTGYFGTSVISPLMVNSGDTLRISTTKTPSSASDTGTTGDHCWDGSYVYVCVATNTWKRAALTTW